MGVVEGLTTAGTKETRDREDRDGERGSVLAIVAAGRSAASRLCFGLFLRDRYLRCLKNSPRQPFKVLASLRSFVIFVFHIP